MAFRLMFVLLPVLAYGNINVRLSGVFDAADPSKIKVELLGNSIEVISDTERETFKLSDANLKRGAQRYFGKSPDDVYVRSPTPFGDLYKSYGWEPVMRNLVPIRGKVLRITSEPTVVHSSLLENNSSKTGTYNAGMHQDVENTVSSSWSTSGSLTVESEITYGFDIEVMSGEIGASLSYTSSWGKDNTKSESVTVGTSNSLEVTLEPGESVIAELLANKGYIEYEVEYDALLKGTMAANYNDVYKGHHFWSMDINEIMRMAGLERNYKSKEVLKLGFYSQSRVIVRDNNKRSVIKKQFHL